MPPDAAPDAPPSPPSTGRRAVFIRRLTTTLGLWGVIAAAIWWGNMYVFFVGLGVLGLLALWEYFHIAGEKIDRAVPVVTFLVAVAYLVGAYWHCAVHGDGRFYHIDVAAIVVLVVGLFAVTIRRPLAGRETLLGITGAIFGFLYAIFLFNFLTRILFVPGVEPGGVARGAFYVLYLIAVTKFTDMGAYAVGSLVGKHKMIPHISPGKTWEGFGGALLGAFVASFGMLALFPEQLGMLGFADGAVLAPLLAVVAVLGDLSESVIKRCVGAKDSGQFLPGIGGALDLVDSLCFTAPVFYCYLLWIQ